MKIRFFSMCIFIFIGFLVGLCCGYFLADVGIGVGRLDVDSGEILSAHSVKLSGPKLRPTADPVEPDIPDSDCVVGMAAPQWKFRGTPVVLLPQSPDVTFSDGTVRSEERMRRFREVYPEAYRHLEAARRAREQQRQLDEARRKSFLANVDPGLLTEEQQNAHAVYIASVADCTRLAGRIRRASEDGLTVPEDTYLAFCKAARSVRGGARAERTALMEAVGRSLGLEDKAVREFCLLIDNILDVTPEAGIGGDDGRGSASDEILKCF